MRSSTNDIDFGGIVRTRVFLGLIIAVFLVFTARLLQLQIVEGASFRSTSDAQAVKRQIRQPVRGAIFDRFGKPIVANIASYSIEVTPNKLTPRTRELLADLLGTDTNDINERIKKLKINDYNPVRIWRDVDIRTWSRLNELHDQFPGVDIVDDSKRAYVSDAHASHILGYTKQVDGEDLKNKGDWYVMGDIIGKNGIEAYWEAQLRGEKGYQYMMVNSRGQKVGRFQDGTGDQQPSNGFDLYLGLDIELQHYAEECLKGYRGAVVAMDPNNGEILAMASSPDYDPNVFSGVVSPAEYRKLSEDAGKPLLNRATQAVYPSGSTWKMLMAIAGMMEGIITPSSTISCPGSFTLGGNTWKCHGAHGAVNARKAIHVSCNVFFYKLGLQLGIDNYEKYGKMFHFGTKLGLDADEGRTRLPNRAYYDRAFGAGKWPKGVLVNLGIGQGELGVNPLQLAAYCASLANGGTWHQPHLVRGIRNVALGTFEQVTHVVDSLHIPLEIMNVIHQGMYDVVNTPGGTASGARIADITVAGKTGTAQAGKGKKDHAWFVCYAPYEQPKIAMCVLVENSGFGGTYSAPIARKLIRFYLKRQREEGMNGGDSTGVELRAVTPWDSADVQESDLLPDSVVQ